MPPDEIAEAAGIVTKTDYFFTASDGTKLWWVSYRPSGPGPFQCCGVGHVGGFKGGSPNDGPVVRACNDLALAGIKAFAVAYRTDRQRLEGQKGDGKYPEQTDDAKASVISMRKDPDCNGVVDWFGGSAGAGHAWTVGTEIGQTGDVPWTANDRARRVVCLSAPLAFYDRTPDPALAPFVADVELYCGTKDLAKQKAMSPLTLTTKDAHDIFIRATQKDPMPNGQFKEMQKIVAALGLRNVNQALLPGSKHAFAYWNDPDPNNPGKTVKDSVIAFLLKP